MFKMLKEIYDRKEEMRNKHFEELAKELSENDPVMELIRNTEKTLKELQEERLIQAKVIEEHKRKLEALKEEIKEA